MFQNNFQVVEAKLFKFTIYAGHLAIDIAVHLQGIRPLIYLPHTIE